MEHLNLSGCSFRDIQKRITKEDKHKEKKKKKNEERKKRSKKKWSPPTNPLPNYKGYAPQGIVNPLHFGLISKNLSMQRMSDYHSIGSLSWVQR